MVERVNRTIVKMAWSILWAKAVNVAIYILNSCSQTIVVFNKTPFGACDNRKQVADKFIVFGCIAYTLNPPYIGEKFVEKGENYIFIS